MPRVPKIKPSYSRQGLTLARVCFPCTDARASVATTRTQEEESCGKGPRAGVHKTWVLFLALPSFSYLAFGQVILASMSLKKLLKILP